jgi:hypothetical protein
MLLNPLSWADVQFQLERVGSYYMTIKNDDSNTQFPADFEAQAKLRFEALDAKEDVDFSAFLRSEKVEFQRLAAIQANPALAYKPKLGTMTACGNGDFEKELDPNEWQGAIGPFPNLHAASPLAGFTAGIFSSSMSADPNGHQSWVGAGPDPIAPISTTATNSAGAVRLGNQHNWLHGEVPCSVLSKTFIVGTSNTFFTFWYALVMHGVGLDDHGGGNPFFAVRALDEFGLTIPNAVDLGGATTAFPNKDRAITNPNNPFWTQFYVPGLSDTFYKDWSCSQINLSNHIGKQVTIEFIVSDCNSTGHFGYAYIDNICGSCKGSPTGSITYDCKSSKHCGKGEICFDYELPKAEVKDPKSGALTTITGNVEIIIEIMQGGVVIDKFGSGLLSSGCSYCFTIDPATIAGIDPTLGGFDFVATGQFSITNTAGSVIQLGSQSMGRAPDGMILGTNNDYKIVCKSCEEIKAEQDAALAKRCANKVNQLQSYDCKCPEGSTGGCGCGCGCSAGCGGKASASNESHANAASKSGCGCGWKSKESSAASAASMDHADCEKLEICADLRPDISISWGDSKCDCLETDDVEVLCVTVCNQYSNITYADLTIGQVVVTNMDGTPVPNLPDGTPSVQVFPSGTIGFGDIGPCNGKNSNCVTRELVLYTRGAIGRDYRLSFAGVCATIQHAAKSEACFILPLCADE